MALKPITLAAVAAACAAAGAALADPAPATAPATPASAPVTPAPKTPADPPMRKIPSVPPAVLSAAPAPKPSKTPVANACRIALAEVKDTRPDAQMGQMGLKVVKAEDPADWVRGGLSNGLSEAKSHLLVVTGADAESDLQMRVEILKAYIQPMNTAKSATIVLRVRYAGAHAFPEPRVYRGVRTAMNWASTTDEIQGAMNLALADAVLNMRGDVMGMCWSKVKS